MTAVVSVCIPTYNGARYLGECIESVLNQTYGGTEILVVDDASTDQTVAIATQYSQRDGRVRVHINPRNLGLVANWNRCLALAHGEWIKFLFQDDLLAPSCIERMLAVAHQEGASFVICRRDFLFDGDTTAATRENYARHAEQAERFAKNRNVRAEKFIEAILNHGICENFLGEPTATLIHRDLFHRYGAFNANLINACDSEFWYRIGSEVGVTFVAESLATFRVHRESASADNHKRRLFRLSMLDPLVVAHEFAYGRHYATLRRVVTSRFGAKYLKRLCDEKAWAAWEAMRNKEANHSPDAGSCRKEWNAVRREYPGLRLMVSRVWIRMRRQSILSHLWAR